jgi:hypothetical protein
MPWTPNEIATRLTAEGEAVLRFFHALAPADWQRVVYTDGAAWRLRDLLAHFIAAETGFQALVQAVASGEAGAPEEFSIDAYNQSTVAEMRALEPLALLGQFAMVRERTAALTAGLTAEQLDLRGRHPFLGDAAVDEMLRAIFHHNTLHLRDARRALLAGPQTEEAA